ncbi:MAG TPA: maleylpyruvate isomerase N-terminal domain-containing protein [Actinomycetota bacterium]|jgi:uncharacterized protein (TIGR03083 family)
MSQGMMTDRDRIRAALVDVAERIAAMIAELADTGVPIPRSEWTVGEAAAHLAYTNIGLAIMARGLFIPYADGTRAGFAEANANALEGYTDRDGALLAGRIVDGVRAFVAEAAAQPPGGTYQTPMGTMDLDTFAAYVLTHNLMHGCQIADALAAPFPFQPEHAAMVWRFLTHAVPLMFNEQAGRDLEACVELTVEGAFSGVLVFGGGRVTLEPSAPGAIDCHLSADPLTFFRVMLQLTNVPDAVAEGGLRISGPRPELGAMLPSLFEVP